MTKSKRSAELAVVRAAMRWFREYGSDPTHWGEGFPSDNRLAKACARLAAARGRKLAKAQAAKGRE